MDDPYREVNNALIAGGLVLTANKRLYRHLRDGFDRQMIAGGHSVWDTPQLFSYEGWLLKCLDELDESWRILNPHQQQYLWEKRIEDSSQGAELELLQIPKTAEKAVQAYRLLNEHGLDLEPFDLTEDQREFKRWLEDYRALAQQHRWLDKSDFPRLVIEALSKGRIILSDHVLLVGFDQLPPGLQQLQECLRNDGVSCEEVGLKSSPAGQVIRYAARDRDDEIEAAARWARQLLDDGNTSVGVVVPDLTRRRRQIERVFRAQIDPQAGARLQDEEAVFSLSLGGPLLDEGVIHAALDCLSFERTPTLENVSFLLRTPYLSGSKTEADARAAFDTRLRSFRQQSFELKRLLSLAENGKGIAGFAKILAQINAYLKGPENAGGKMLPGAWARYFADQLREFGWPGDRSLSSREYQAIQSWRDHVLAVMPGLDSLQVAMTRQQALGILRRLTRDTEFQIEAPSGPVQVVGLLESTGLKFDHLWVMGLEETVLPGPAQPNPFIPYRLQVDYEMPHASAERELIYSEQIIERLAAAAEKVIFSYPRFEGDRELKESPLIPAQASPGLPAMAAPCDLLSLSRRLSLKLDSIPDFTGPLVEETLVEGGTALLKDQAHCPFRAFVHHRLHARALDEAAPGISPMERGDLVHRTLESFWSEVCDRDRLEAFTAEERAVTIDRHVNSVIEDFYLHRPEPASVLIQLEKQRIGLLVEEWLTTVEMKRDFFRVEQVEDEHIEQLGPLQIRMKIDRVDRLGEGASVIIDYKTGSQLRADDFISTPLVEPQLPIYAVAQPGKGADGIVFAQIRKGGCRLLGVVREQGLLGRVSTFDKFAKCEELGITDWSELLTFWREQIHQLAADFVAGKAIVYPYDTNTSCRYCDLPGLCRIRESLRSGESFE